MTNENHECLVALAEKWQAPFEKPISFNRITGEMTADMWMIKVFNWTKSGNVSKNGSAFLHINYCPLCGEDFRVHVPEVEDEKE